MAGDLIVSNVSTLVFAMAGLVFGVNIIVEVMKKLIPKLPTTILTAVVAEIFTLVAFFAWASYNGLTILWYYVAAAVILGLFVAYAAMFGFDKFKEAIERWKSYRK